MDMFKFRLVGDAQANQGGSIQLRRRDNYTMKANPLLRTSVLTVLVTLSICRAGQAGNVDCVNTYIGTGDIPGVSKTEYGGTMPLVQPPFAMTSWTAQTRENSVSVASYNYADTNISGFIGTHQPSIWAGDFGYVTLMPGVDEVKPAKAKRQLPFSHRNETSTPYYYSVSMDAGASRKLRGELTATDHCAILRFTFPQNTNSSIVVQATRAGVTGNVVVNAAKQEISGWNPDRMDAKLTSLQLPNFKGYFVVQLSKPFSSCGTYQGESVNPALLNRTGTDVGACATFSTSSEEQVLVRIGTSFISVDQARANLKLEIPNWDFDKVKTGLRDTWNKKLGEISIQGATPDRRVQFYTGMYHAMLCPRLFSEYGRYYSAFDDQVHKGVSYTDYSLWDTFRAQNSFITLFCPERINDMVQALLNDYKEGGWMPKWPNPSYTDLMLSTHADSLVAEAIKKGFHGFDYKLAYAAVYQDAMTPPNGDTTHKWADRDQGQPFAAREGLTYYKKYGYVPEDWTARAASCTLEGAYDDWCVAQVAKAAGKTDDYNFFLTRSLNYTNLFNARTGQMNSRYADGTWAPPDAGWSEGGQKMYNFAVMHDVPGLIDLMGGTSNFNFRLDRATTDLNALVNNEPGNHYPYLYDYSGQPWKCQSIVRAALTNFSNAPDGLPGNDDCGQTSSWMLFAALGFYPVNPASGIYMLGSPWFDRVTLHLPNGHAFEIAAAHNSPSNVYVQSVTLNGSPLNVPYLTHDQIQKGGTLRFVMGSSPSAWAADWRGAPLQIPHPHPQPLTPPVKRQSFVIGDDDFLIDGKPIVIRCGEMHFARIPREYWRHRLQMARAMGLNAVCVYLFWNFQEPQPGQFNWSDRADAAAFCRLAQEEGLWVILRPGPYACAEWDFGGLPWWLLQTSDIRIRSRDPRYLEASKRYLLEVGGQLAPLQVTRGGPILMVQIENEYGVYGTDREYLGITRDYLKGAGFDVPFFTCDPANWLKRDTRDDIFCVVNLGSDPAGSFKILREVQPTGPLMVGEYYPGWFDSWDEPHHTGTTTNLIADLRYMLEHKASFSIYMAHGGTTFGPWSGANAPPFATHFTPQTSSYDYDAPISEAGWPTEKFYAVQDLLKQHLAPGEELPPVPARNSIISIPEIAFRNVAPMLANLPPARQAHRPGPMESFGQAHGCILYRHPLPAGPAVDLKINELHDYGLVFLDGCKQAVLDYRLNQNTVHLPARSAAVTLDVLVEAMGRVNNAAAGTVSVLHDCKGITENVLLGEKELLGQWEVFPLPLEDRPPKGLKFKGASITALPAFYHASFKLKSVGDTFLDMRTWGKGMVWVNGHNLGRFWRVGPTQTMYLPGPWLKRGQNDILILDLVGPENAIVQGLTEPILDQLRH